MVKTKSLPIVGRVPKKFLVAVMRLYVIDDIRDYHVALFRAHHAQWVLPQVRQSRNLPSVSIPALVRRTSLHIWCVGEVRSQPTLTGGLDSRFEAGEFHFATTSLGADGTANLPDAAFLAASSRSSFFPLVAPAFSCRKGSSTAAARSRRSLDSRGSRITFRKWSRGSRSGAIS